ncbi:MAG: lipoate--protein ligase [Firmicutes bacterium]|nr:lipoate--protein ligase [Bacillota bacterium]
MKELEWVRTDCTDPWINLAMEEYLTFRAREGQVLLFLWQNARTVVIGRNQDPWRECRVETMKEEGCRLARRISGGGAVYHDLGNLNFTFIARDGWFDVNRQTEVILQAVRKLGIDAEKNGRNDLTAEGRKFSGHAYYQSGPYRYHHGTIMMDVDGDELAKYLNVSAAKLASKGVASVRSRVANLTEFCPGLTRAEMERSLLEAYEEVYGQTGRETALPERSDPELQALIEKYSSEEWRYGRKIPFGVSFEGRFEWGGAEARIEAKGGRIREAKVYTDALDTELFRKMEEDLKGARYDRETLRKMAEEYGEEEPPRAVLEMIVRQMQ